MKWNSSFSRVWHPAPAEVVCLPGQIHLWRVTLPKPELLFSSSASWLQVLSAEEQARGARLIKLELRQRFWLAHAILRFILSQYVTMLPVELRFYQGEHGKPYLEGSTLQFNLSHSREALLLGVAWDLELGVDIEYMQSTVEANELAARFFSQEEANCLRALPAVEQKTGFYRLWSRKEAYIKAIGWGLTYPLHYFTVSLQDTVKNCLLAVEGKRASGLTVLGLGEMDDYAMAVAYVGAGYELCLWQADSERLLPCF